MVKTEVSPEELGIIEGYALDGCQNGTIAGLMGWDPEWLHQRPDILKKLTKKRQQRKLNIRRGQNNKALEVKDNGDVEGKDTAMLIFLGKNDLGQADKQEMIGLGALPAIRIEIVRELPAAVKQIESEVIDV